jgi:hypothetical protein
MQESSHLCGRLCFSILRMDRAPRPGGKIVGLVYGTGHVIKRGQDFCLTNYKYVPECDMIDLQSIIENYGYVALLVGTFLEGETILVLAGLAAHQGYLVLTWVILAAFLGSLCSDQLFLFGRKHSQAVLSRCPAWKEKAEIFLSI